ncbi:MAG: N-acetylmuramoyl-L-alanine amidase [Lachnospiraceae bacterium]|nr:N-acetylmuramoyl-L-alanine amidase [Lachnospiraceae bacterium]
MKNKITVTTCLTLLSVLFFSLNCFGAVICLDPGHGGPGTTGCGALYPPYMEKALNLDVAGRVKAELEAAGHTVYMTRTSDVSMSLEERAIYAKSVNADVLISIHFNSSGPHDKHGTEVWTSAFGTWYSTGLALGRSIISQFEALGFESKGVKTKLGSKGDYYGLIRNGVALGIPSVIVEQCFIDNPGDRAILDGRGTAALAHADAAGIISFFQSDAGKAITAGSVTPTTIPVPAAAEENKASEQDAAAVLSGNAPAGAPERDVPAQPAPQVSKTKYGFPVDANGNVTYTDTAGGQEVFTAGEWTKLLANWSYTEDPEYYLRTISAKDLRTILEK